ncbi:hypothetical protein GGS20DRAFT_572956 [Poronia punctata]|nr:hypothetical protein GGS20DRAFT_572956 [Poronia punctata]
MSSEILLPTSLSDESLLAACVAPTVIAAIFVLIRLANSWQITGKLHLDDWMSLLALAFLIALSVLSYIGATVPNNPRTPLATIPQVFATLVWVSAAALYFGKVPLLVMVLRVFETSRWVRINTYIVLVAPPVLFAGGAIYVTIYCSTVGKIVTKCLQTGLALGIWNGAVAVISDIIILAIPFPVIFKLNVARNKKVGLLLLFLTGIFTLITSAVTLYFKASSLAGSSVNIIGSVIGALLEAAIALVVSCLPAIRALWLSQVVPSTLYTSLMSMIAIKRRRRESKTPLSREMGANDSNFQGNTSHVYIELADASCGWRADETSHGNV